MKPYEAFEQRYNKVAEASAKQFPKECELMEESIVSCFAAFNLVKVSQLDEHAQSLAALFYRNCIYLSASYHLIRNGMLDPAGNNMRTVFETIVWQYAYLCDKEMYGNFREVGALEEQKLALLPKKEWSNTKERELENLRRKYGFQKAMKRLYTKETYEKFFFSQYWMLCQKSHSSMFGINYNTPTMQGLTTMDTRPEELRANLSALLYLAAENLLCFLNCFADKLPKEKTEPILAFTNKINRSIPPSLSLAPDTMELPFTARFRELE
ncbi:hypothetical protein H0O00_00085 [Candidatus Micrarchaeota archaeon]|nr:hypothetical protein [Candidatus Micrarchaeota archaeon]